MKLTLLAIISTFGLIIETAYFYGRKVQTDMLIDHIDHSTATVGGVIAMVLAASMLAFIATLSYLMVRKISRFVRIRRVISQANL